MQNHLVSARLRARIFAILGTSMLGAWACGGDTVDETAEAGSGAGGTTSATGGTGGGTGGTITGGVGGGGPVIKCLDDQQMASFCDPNPDGGYTPWSCFGLDGLWADGGGWIPDSGCPSSIRPNSTSCESYSQPEVVSGQCCYSYDDGVGGCGRPFIVGGATRRAKAGDRSDWLSKKEGDTTHLDGPTRRALADAWLVDALLEHASIASFARFTLELLALGAPADLVADAQRAAADEVEHARLCFGLASRYAGRDLGPEPLPVDGSLAAISLAEAAARTAREACVGETLAAFVASEQLDRATDLDVRSALSRIAEDEAVHAELAWRFVAWAIATGGESVRRAVTSEFGAAIGEMRRAKPMADRDIDASAFAAHGRLNAEEQREAELRALVEIVEPTAKALTSFDARQRVELAPQLI